ncbi:hypothetical protein K457DRAFT_317642 [Linnemannia elongata AG-77]|uniref:Uncharacterized protein n=1 Tax=Linnemannia elongata AG-77 TaxID=1314771 RepID=A0A197K3L3_9FUNG|nr:hypothetical protein K457DRAFT_317642 [Linnemannia elongata AG-77]
MSSRRRPRRLPRRRLTVSLRVVRPASLRMRMRMMKWRLILRARGNVLLMTKMTRRKRRMRQSTTTRTIIQIWEIWLLSFRMEMRESSRATMMIKWRALATTKNSLFFFCITLSPVKNTCILIKHCSTHILLF